MFNKKSFLIILLFLFLVSFFNLFNQVTLEYVGISLNVYKEFEISCGTVIEIFSNVTAKTANNPNDIKKLLIDQIEKPVRWRESVRNMIDNGTHKFIEIGPGKVLSGLIKRIDRNIKLIQVNNLSDIKNINND